MRNSRKFCDPSGTTFMVRVAARAKRMSPIATIHITTMEFVRVLLEACLYPPAARRDVDTVLLDVGQAWRRAPGDDGEKRHADRERGEREAARPSDFRHAGFRDFRSTV